MKKLMLYWCPLCFAVRGFPQGAHIHCGCAVVMPAAPMRRITLSDALGEFKGDGEIVAEVEHV